MDDLPSCRDRPRRPAGCLFDRLHRRTIVGGSGLGGGRRAVRDATAGRRCLFGWRPIAKYKFGDSVGGPGHAFPLSALTSSSPDTVANAMTVSSVETRRPAITPDADGSQGNWTLETDARISAVSSSRSIGLKSTLPGNTRPPT